MKIEIRAIYTSADGVTTPDDLKVTFDVEEPADAAYAVIPVLDRLLRPRPPGALLDLPVRTAGHLRSDP